MTGPATPLRGRDDDVAELVAILTGSGARLLTLTGPPGVGKTRLAQVAASAVADRFESGVAWVDLAPVADPVRVLDEIGLAVGVTATATELATVLAARELLLVLDNCEHVLDAAPEIAALLDACTRVRMLATSRERWRVAAEHVVAVPPLAMPAPEQAADLPALLRNPAIALLLDRAPSAVRLTERTAPDLIDMCRRVDGLPLALELAAARLRVFTPAELSFRLRHRMGTLTAAARDAPVRHRDLRAAMAWSHDLLPERDQEVFRRISVFEGTWTLEAAAAVCGFPDVANEVESLLDKSLLQRADDGREVVDAARFALLPSVREFAADELTRRDETTATRARHAHWFAQWARQWETAVGTPAETEAWPLVGPMRSDLRSALTAVASPADERSDDAGWLAVALGWYGYTRGHLPDGAAMIEVLVGAGDSDPELRCAALLAGGNVAYGLGDLTVARDELTECLRLATECDDRRRPAVTHAFLGHVARADGAYEQAAAHYAAARALFTERGDARGLAWSAHDAALLALDTGDVTGAETGLREALGLFRSLGYTWAVAVCCGALATTLLRGDVTTESAALLEEALLVHEQVGDRRGTAQSLEAVADLASRRGSPRPRCGCSPPPERSALRSSSRPGRADAARLRPRRAARATPRAQRGTDHERQAGWPLPTAAAIALATGRGGRRDARDRAWRRADARGSSRSPRWSPPDSTNRQIGRALGISEKTAETHLRNIMERLDAPSRAGVAAWAASHGLPRGP